MPGSRRVSPRWPRRWPPTRRRSSPSSSPCRASRSTSAATTAPTRRRWKRRCVPARPSTPPSRRSDRPAAAGAHRAAPGRQRHGRMLIAFNKPYGVLCQFTDRSATPRPTLAGFGLPPGVYPAGRLDFDSEGLLLLTDDGALAHRLTDPRHKLEKTYWVQVEGDPG